MNENYIDGIIWSFIVVSFSSIHWGVCAGFCAFLLSLMRIVSEYPKFRKTIIEWKKSRRANSKKKSEKKFRRANSQKSSPGSAHSAGDIESDKNIKINEFDDSINDADIKKLHEAVKRLDTRKVKIKAGRIYSSNAKSSSSKKVE